MWITRFSGCRSSAFCMGVPAYWHFCVRMCARVRVCGMRVCTQCMCASAYVAACVFVGACACVFVRVRYPVCVCACACTCTCIVVHILLCYHGAYLPSVSVYERDREGRRNRESECVSPSCMFLSLSCFLAITP